MGSHFIEAGLSNRTHQKYRNIERPESLVIMGNETYDFLNFNCMHMSALILRYGTHRDNQSKFYKAMNNAFHSILWPNRVYIDVFNSMGRKELLIGS